jgi:hypothetical protein
MKTRILGLVGALALAGCGDDRTPTAPTTPVPTVAGTYSSSTMWLIQFQRQSDGWRSAYNCSGTLTLAQGTSAGSIASLTGFATVGGTCPSASFQLSGTIDVTGAITLQGDGPRPPDCQAARATYTGVIANRTLSARTTQSLSLSCSGDVQGVHTYDFIINAFRTS